MERQLDWRVDGVPHAIMVDGRKIVPDTKVLLDYACERGGVIMIENAMLEWTIKDNEIWTGPLWVHPDHRRKGLATRIVHMLAEEGKKRNLEWICSKTAKQRKDVTAMYKSMNRKIAKEEGGLIYWKDRIEDLC